jgi:inner membrane protein
MDNLTHSLVGWALGQAGLKQKTRKGLAALVLGANMPDIDVFFGWVPWGPLAMHRGFTHGLVGGVLLMPPLLASMLWCFDRWQQRRGATFTSGLELRFGWLVALCYIGAISHPLLDWQNSYAVQLLSPFSESWFHNDSLFIIDVWVWSALALAIWWSRKRERLGRSWPSAPRLALAGLVAYLTANSALSDHAKQQIRRADPDAQPDVILATPPPVLFWRRELVWRDNGVISWGTYDPLSDPAVLRITAAALPDGMDHPHARHAARANPEIVDFMRWSLLPIARVEASRCDVVVSFGDARYGRTVSDNRFRQEVRLPADEPGC